MVISFEQDTAKGIWQRFTTVNDYAANHGYVGGFPNLHERDSGNGNGTVYGTILLKSGVAEWQDISYRDLGPYTHIGPIRTNRNTASGIQKRFTAVHDYAVNHGYVGGFPNLHERDDKYGVVLLKSGVAEWQDIPYRDLGPRKTNRDTAIGIQKRFAAVHDYAVNHGYVGGFPNLHEAEYANGTVYGAILFKTSPFVTSREISFDFVTISSNVLISDDFSENDKRRIKNAHLQILSDIRDCNSLNANEREALRKRYYGYKKVWVGRGPPTASWIPMQPFYINHDKLIGKNIESVTGRANKIYGTKISLNTDHVDFKDNTSLTVTIIHEMMHLAGFNHPIRNFFLDCKDGHCKEDIPGDNGPYYGSTPLKAETCIDSISSSSSGLCSSDSTGACIMVSPTVSIKTILYDPIGDDVQKENVVIVNLGNQPIDMTNWTLRDKKNHIFKFPSFRLGKNEEMKLWTKSGNNDTRNLYWKRRKAVWNNKGDSAFLLNSARVVMATFTY